MFYGKKLFRKKFQQKCFMGSLFIILKKNNQFILKYFLLKFFPKKFLYIKIHLRDHHNHLFYQSYRFFQQYNLLELFQIVFLPIPFLKFSFP